MEVNNTEYIITRVVSTSNNIYQFSFTPAISLCFRLGHAGRTEFSILFSVRIRFVPFEWEVLYFSSQPATCPCDNAFTDFVKEKATIKGEKLLLIACRESFSIQSPHCPLNEMRGNSDSVATGESLLFLLFDRIMCSDKLT